MARSFRTNGDNSNGRVWESKSSQESANVCTSSFTHESQKPRLPKTRSPGFLCAVKPMSGYVRAVQEATLLMVSSITSVSVVPKISSLKMAR